MEPTAAGNTDDDVDSSMEEGEIDDADIAGDNVDNGDDGAGGGAVEAADAETDNNHAGDDVAGDEDEDVASDEMVVKEVGDETGDVAEEDDESASKSDSPPTANGTNDAVGGGGDDTTPDGETPSDDAASAKADAEDLSNSKSESVDSDDNNKAGVAYDDDDDDDKMEVDGDPSEGETGGGNETAEESAKELPYSTRGRSTAGSGGEERSSTAVGIEPVGQTLEELSRPKEAGTSFLVETMTEEERRTRTRYIPDVDGMHVLRKNEVKDDIAFARSLPSTVSAQGSIQLRTGRLASSSGRRRGSDMDLDDAAASFNDGGSTTIELTHNEVTVPSDVFVSPEGVSVGDTEGTIVVKETDSSKAKANAPSHIETTVAFNPPRPPESIGDKKKHRVLRWERRPDDIELDMKNYRRTVQRTRQELQKSEAELNRLETVDAHLRRHFLNNLDLLGEESDQLRECVQSEIQKLSKFTGLAGSRTRNRNAPKPGAVMRDVLSVLQKGDMSEVAAVDDSIITEAAVDTVGEPGIGGLNSASFVDWDRSTNIKKCAPAMAWLEPGQAVKTRDGDGIVVEVLPVEIPNDDSSEEKKDEDQKAAPVGEAADEKKDHLSAVKKKPDAADVTAKEEEEKKAAREKEHDKVKSLEPPRVKVRIADDVKVFKLDAITLADNPAHYSDKKLAKRWKGMIKSALQVGSCIDMEGLSSVASASSANGSDINGEGNNGTGSGDNGGSGSGTSNGLPADDDGKTFLPVNASLFPTIAGRGNLLQSMKIVDIENELHDALFEGHGVLGRVSRSYLLG